MAADFYWKMRLLGPKDSKEKIWENWGYLKTRFWENACKMGLGAMIKTENEEIKGEDSWSEAACPRWPCRKCGLL